MNIDHPTHKLFYQVLDNRSPIPDCPAMTTFLYKVCQSDQEKFEEGARLISLFMEAAYVMGKNEGKTNV